jgi:hypothetical protein
MWLDYRSCKNHDLRYLCNLFINSIMSPLKQEMKNIEGYLVFFRENNYGYFSLMKNLT